MELMKVYSFKVLLFSAENFDSKSFIWNKFWNRFNLLCSRKLVFRVWYVCTNEVLPHPSRKNSRFLLLQIFLVTLSSFPLPLTAMNWISNTAILPGITDVTTLNTIHIDYKPIEWTPYWLSGVFLVMPCHNYVSTTVI